MSESIPRITSPHDVANMFRDREGSPDYVGYGKCAADVVAALDTIALAVAMKTETSIPLPLHPQKDAEDDPFKSFGESQLSNELMNRIYDVTRADVVSDTRSEVDPYGKVVLHAWHEGEEFNFVETYARSKDGDYSRWEAMTSVPEPILVPQARHFVTTGERMPEWDEELDRAALEALFERPPVDEPEVVKDWLRRQVQERQEPREESA